MHPAEGGFFGGDACGGAFMTNLRLREVVPSGYPLLPPLWFRRSCPPPLSGERRGLTRQGFYGEPPPLRGEVLRRGGIPLTGPRSAPLSPYYMIYNKRLHPLG
jgi:hypothetical protein